jgi:ABC-type phosphate transport system substrate-binding protein
MALLGLTIFGPAQAAQAATYVPLVGQGSTYAAPALDQWATDMEPDGLHITYTPNGSAAGRQAWLNDQVDFAGSDIAFLFNGDADPFGGTDRASSPYAYSYIPDVAGGLSFMYNLQVDGHKISNMRLSGQTLAEIFTGHITNWDNPAITHDYGTQLPSIPITVVTRSDGAGESYFLSNWMNTMYPSLWQPFCKNMGGPAHCGPTELFPGQAAGFKSLDGSDLLSNYIAQSSNNGAIGYAEYAYALQYNLPVVQMLNAAGYYVGPTASNVAIALEAAQINSDQNSVDFLMQTLTDVYEDRDPRTYPLSSYSYLIVARTNRTENGTRYGPPTGFTTGKGQSMSTFINYMLCQAQQSAGQLGYSPLPQEMVQGGFTQDGYIPGAVRSPAAGNYNNCDNPAYHDGVDVLTKQAPYPTACQKVGSPLDCTVVDGRAVSTNPNSNTSGSTNPNSTGPNSGNNTPGSKNSTSSPGSGINPSTGLPYSNSPGSATNDAADQPTALASQPAEQWLFGVLTAILLIAAVTVPTLLGSWLQRSRHSGPGSGPGGPPRPPRPPIPPRPAPTGGES